MFNKLLQRLKQWIRKPNDPPFLLAPKPPAFNVSDGDKVNAKCLCPMCHSYWADVDIVLGRPLSASQFKLREGYRHWKLSAGEQIVCPACGYEYTSWAIQAMVLAALNQQKIAPPAPNLFLRRDK